MDFGFFDMFYDVVYKDIFVVVQCIDIDFDGVIQILVEQQWVGVQYCIDLVGFVIWVFGMYFGWNKFGQCVQKIGIKCFVVVNDLYGVIIQDIGWVYYQWQVELIGDQVVLFD